MDHIEHFEDTRGQYRFRVKGDNGEIVAQSEGYASRSNAIRGAGTLRRLLLPPTPILSIPVLDHGCVALHNLAGPTRRAHMPFDASDIDPAQAARMSFNNFDEDRTAEEDHRLSNYLMKNWHTSPFEMIECWFVMKLPIFVARQFVRHRTVSINEVSARYITLPEEWYIPDVVGGKAPNAKQGQADNLSAETQAWFKLMLDTDCQNSYSNYLQAIHAGVAPEHARMFLHLNHYTHWLWKQDLHNILNFLRLRDHFHAQIEAQKYAQAIDYGLRLHLPKSMELYDEYRRLKPEPVQLGWLLEGPGESDIVHYEAHKEPLTPADRDAGWTARPLYALS